MASTTNEVRGAIVVTGMRLILKGCQKLAGGRRQAHHRSTASTGGGAPLTTGQPQTKTDSRRQASTVHCVLLQGANHRSGNIVNVNAASVVTVPMCES